jgi:hypothetical protein
MVQRKMQWQILQRILRMKSASTEHGVLYLFYDNAQVFVEAETVPSPILTCLAQKYLCIPATRLQVNKFSAQHLFF